VRLLGMTSRCARKSNVFPGREPEAFFAGLLESVDSSLQLWSCAGVLTSFFPLAEVGKEKKVAVSRSRQ
jgi:hypothetical protein